MLRKLTQPDGRPFYINSESVIGVDTPPEGTPGRARLLVSGWETPIRVAETPDEAFDILYPVNANGTRG